MSDLYDYTKDWIARECLILAEKSKSDIGFGAVLLKENHILGRGWNRLSTKAERALLTHVDYAIHAEQASIADALMAGLPVTDGRVYVLGKVLKGKLKGRLTHREVKGFGCVKCPHTFLRYNLPVFVSLLTGWARVEAFEALVLAKSVCGKGMWSSFRKNREFSI